MTLLNNVTTFAVITGASRGIGHALALELSEKCGPNSLLCLIARNQQALDETAREVKGKAGDKIDVECIAADLSDGKIVAELNHSIYGNIGDASRFGAALIIHNAGSMPLTKYSREMDDIEFIQGFNMLKLTSVMAMNVGFLKTFREIDTTLKTIVQMTSIGGRLAVKTGHLYCMAKTARDVLFKVLALEEPEVRVLSFDPGSVDTVMFNAVYDSADPEVRAFGEFSKQQPNFIQPAQAAKNLLKVIEEDKFESGAVVRGFEDNEDNSPST